VPVLAGSLAVPRLATLDVVAAVLAVAAFAGLRWRRWPVPAVVLGAAALGLLAYGLGLLS
jgi:hypothetical protein